MTQPDRPETRRVLIASSHGLFGQGLRSLLSERQEAGVEVVGMVSNLDEALEALENLNPDLIIVDYDDEILNRDEFLARFVEGEKKLRVVLLSVQVASVCPPAWVPARACLRPAPGTWRPDGSARIAADRRQPWQRPWACCRRG